MCAIWVTYPFSLHDFFITSEVNYRRCTTPSNSKVEWKTSWNSSLVCFLPLNPLNRTKLGITHRDCAIHEVVQIKLCLFLCHQNHSSLVAPHLLEVTADFWQHIHLQQVCNHKQLFLFFQLLKVYALTICNLKTPFFVVVTHLLIRHRHLQYGVTVTYFGRRYPF